MWCRLSRRLCSSIAARSISDSGISAEQLGGRAQHDPRIADPPGDADPIEVFQNLDRQVAADAGSVLEQTCPEALLRRLYGQRGGEIGQPYDRLWQEKAVRCYRRNAPEALGPLQEPSERLGFEPERPRQLAHPWRTQLLGGEQRPHPLPQLLVLAAEARLMLGQAQHRAVAHHPTVGG